MQIHRIDAENLDLFLRAGGRPEDREDTRRYVDSMFEAGSMCPEWCFVAADGSETLGRVALWGLPSVKEPLALVLLDTLSDDRFETTGRELLEYVKGEARRLGATELEHVVDVPPVYPQYQHGFERRIGILEGAGFALRRETVRYEWIGGESPTVSDRLEFRTLPEVGDGAFVEAMMRVSEGTLDREILEERERLGPDRAAQDFFEDARKVDHDPDWWRLAYTPDGELAGLVIPANPPAFMTIFYVGVVPEMRGRGYVDDLLAAGTAILLEARSDGQTSLRADTDIANAPMAASFERIGWTEFARRSEYRADLGGEA